MKKEIRYFMSRPKKILFDHLPKCGGSSLNAYLAAHYPKRKVFSINGINPTESLKEFKSLSRHKRHSFDIVKGHLAHELFDFTHPNILKITVLREPVDRIISHYYYAKCKGNHYLHTKILESGMTLEEYASSDLSGELRNWYTTHFSGYSISDAESSPKESIARATEVILKRYNILGFLDDFTSFTKKLQNQAHLWSEYQDMRVNVTKKRPPLEVIPLTTIDRIEKINFLDIALYRNIRDMAGSGG